MCFTTGFPLTYIPKMSIRSNLLTLNYVSLSLGVVNQKSKELNTYSRCKEIKVHTGEQQFVLHYTAGQYKRPP